MEVGEESEEAKTQVGDGPGTLSFIHKKKLPTS
jgi:hypothetical protein